MTTKAADDFDSIARRLAEIEAEHQIARTGSSAPTKEEKAEDLPMGYGDYLAVQQYQNALADSYAWASVPLKSTAHPNWPYAGTGFEWRKFVRS